MTTGTATATIGSGEHVVLCVHGWFGSARGWGMLADVVDEGAFTYVLADARGYGEKRGVTGRFTIEELADDTLALAEELGADRFSILGHSMGAKAAAYAQLLQPDRVRSLVAANPVPPSGVPMDAETWSLFSGAADSAENRKAIIDLTTGNRHPDAWLDRMVEHSLVASDQEAFAAYCESWVTGDFHEQIAAPNLPVLVVAGANDPAMSTEVMKQTWLQWYPGATLVTMPECGHYPMFETPVAFAGEVESFLRRH